MYVCVSVCGMPRQDIYLKGVSGVRVGFTRLSKSNHKRGQCQCAHCVEPREKEESAWSSGYGVGEKSHRGRRRGRRITRIGEYPQLFFLLYLLACVRQYRQTGGSASGLPALFLIHQFRNSGTCLPPLCGYCCRRILLQLTSGSIAFTHHDCRRHQMLNP